MNLPLAKTIELEGIVNSVNKQMHTTQKPYNRGAVHSEACSPRFLKRLRRYRRGGEMFNARAIASNYMYMRARLTLFSSSPRDLRAGTFVSGCAQADERHFDVSSIKAKASGARHRKTMSRRNMKQPLAANNASARITRNS